MKSLPSKSFIFLHFLILLNFGCYNNKSTNAELTDVDDPMMTRLLDLMKISIDTTGSPDYRFEWEREEINYSISRLIIKNNAREDIPCYLLIPDNIVQPYPVMICLQGHSPGMYISIGEARSKKDSALIEGGRDFAMQAINNGWAAITVEQKGFGERSVDAVDCNDLSLRELMRGKPMLGQRVKDISTVINFISSYPAFDHQTIACIGQSSGATTSYFAACVDPRISLAIVSCSFSTYESSWLAYHHCSCGYLPSILEVGDMPNFASLIVPRKLIIVAGKNDPIADIQGVREGFQIAKQYYNDYGAAENILLIEGGGGHQFYPDLTWPIIE